MAPPAAPIDLTLTQAGTGYGYGTLEWDHAASPEKMQVLYKRPYDEAWKSLHLRNASVFGAGPYSMDVPLTEEIEYTVKAINAAGEASAAATEVVFSGSVDGTWLLPFNNGAITETEISWVGGSSPTLDSDRDGNLLTIPTREAEVNMTTGVLHLGKGSLSGLLMTRHSIDADDWLGRLERLVKRQKKSRWVWLASPRWMFKVELMGPISRGPTVAGGRAYTVDVGIRELPTNYGA